MAGDRNLWMYGSTENGTMTSTITLTLRCFDIRPKIVITTQQVDFSCNISEPVQLSTFKYRSYDEAPSWFRHLSTEVEETMKRIQSHKGVVGVVVVNAEGIPIKSTLDNATTVQYAGLISQLADKGRTVIRDLDPTNDLTFLRLRSKKHEIMVAPDKEYMLIVIQNQTD